APPPGRLLGRRRGYAVNLPQLIKLAGETGTALELNANRQRLDLSAEWVRKAQKAGVQLAIDSDSHSVSGFADMVLGVQTAQRGWIRPETVLNTRSLESFTAFIRQKKEK
ncbi:MAG: hypothetical protein K8E24_013205, partial [Methanobacterium paludis]|nr:hypothetical protein [Methanobacterium paludis]